MVVNSWSDHRGKWRDAGFSNDASPKISKPCRRVTVVGAERSIPLRGTRTFCEGPAELQPHILGPAVLREQQILYHDLRRIARRGGIDAHSRRGRCWRPAERRQDTGCLVRRPWVAVLPCGRAVCRSEPGGHAVSRRPRRPFRLGGLPGGPARRPWVAVLPCGRTFVGVNPADTPSAGAPGGRSVWGATRRLFGPAVLPCGHAVWRFDAAARRLSA